MAALRRSYTIAYNKMYELRIRNSEKQHTLYALCSQYLHLAVYEVEICQVCLKMICPYLLGNNCLHPSFYDI